ncbi:ribokinase [Oceanomicrobium pacificus]|uniref:Ribokinase n=1 Tax=Oceanomicrobium pacificus TaxID=2692916 RepID=A0A6B0TTI7_9RHOB|nr:ribokinase [Oceanomicrobium pacificus]MXU64552.1 ribokinase [Oceanomicrobium pacificus]
MIHALGSINVDIVTRVDHLPGPGETVSGSDYRLIPGGKGANQVVAAARAGGDVRFAGAVGQDAFADIALSLLEQSGADLGAVARVDAPTGIALIPVAASGENSIVVAPGANAHVAASQLDLSAAGEGDILMIQNEVPEAEIGKALALARDAGLTVVHNAAPAKALDPAIYDLVNVLIVNETEGQQVAAQLGLETGAPDAVAAALSRRLGAAIVMTLGPEGALLAQNGALTPFPAPTITPVDTTGAGDAFVGALCATLSSGAGLEEAIRTGIIGGSLACLTEGAQTSSPTAGQIAAQRAAG